MSDLIDRKVAIDAVKRLSLGETDATRLAMRIGDYLERLPSAEPKLGELASNLHQTCIKLASSLMQYQ